MAYLGDWTFQCDGFTGGRRCTAEHRVAPSQRYLWDSYKIPEMAAEVAQDARPDGEPWQFMPDAGGSSLCPRHAIAWPTGRPVAVTPVGTPVRWLYEQGMADLREIVAAAQERLGLAPRPVVYR